MLMLALQARLDLGGVFAGLEVGVNRLTLFAHANTHLLLQAANDIGFPKLKVKGLEDFADGCLGGATRRVRQPRRVIPSSAGRSYA